MFGYGAGTRVSETVYGRWRNLSYLEILTSS